MLNCRGKISEAENSKFLPTSIWLNSKNSQISETMTWVIATTAIIVILVLSILIVSFGFKEKKFDAQGGYSDLLVTKSFMGYLLSDDGGGKVYQNYLKVPSEKRHDGKVMISSKLAKQIFSNILYYVGAPDHVWLGFIFVQGTLKNGVAVENALPNDFFSAKEGPANVAGKGNYVFEEIVLDKDWKLGLEVLNWVKKP